MKLSKSKLALAKVINESGGWPDEGNYVVQQDDLGLYASTGKPIWMKKSGRFSIEYCAFICDAKKITNRHQAVLSREEYYQDYPKVDADGWIEWKGGDCPIWSGSLIDVKYRDGHLQVGCRAGSRCDTELYATTHWGNSGGAADIIAYRLHKPEVKPECCESVMRSIPEPESKPTIEQLAQDYRNAKDYAVRLQKEADNACAKSDSILCKIELAGEEIGFIMNLIKGD